MPIRLKITMLFALLVSFILGLVCTGIYYFSQQARLDSIQRRLTNRAITTSRLLSQPELFNEEMVKRIDSLTTISLKNKAVQAYDRSNRKVYNYGDAAEDSLPVSDEVLNSARANRTHYFLSGEREAVAYYNGTTGLLVVSAGHDVEGKESLQNLKTILLFCFLGGTLIVLVSGYIFSTRLLLPVKKITSDVEEISTQNLARRIETGRTRDEWFKLADTLNQLLNRLQEGFELQRRFISNASHELSTPLTSISSQLEVAFQRERGAEEYKAVMQSIYHDVRHMHKLTRTLLEFAKASGSAGGLEINLVRVDEILFRLPDEMTKLNPLYSVSLQFGNLPEDQESLLVFGNEELLMTAIRNIVINACKYSEGHQAHVKMDVHEESILVVISDNGKGIPEPELKTIFQPFYRVEENLAAEGFGLGLSLADRIVKLHKGSIRVESQLNVGTVFTIDLPMARSLL